MENIIKILIGVIVIVLGVLIIFVPGALSNFWLAFIWIPGLAMELSGLKKGEEKGLLVPGGIILTVAVILTLGVIFPTFISDGGWALFILAPAIGLGQLYVASEKKEKGLLIPVGILTTLSLIFLLTSFASGYASVIIGILLVAGGAFILLKDTVKKE